LTVRGKGNKEEMFELTAKVSYIKVRSGGRAMVDILASRSAPDYNHGNHLAAHEDA
jgi:hypothetical protein